ncbi:MAG: hypothetical protein CFE21_21690 [Bacteroidetes bacterium B1(2017)]|nr:MAG: hypothetical protein CFE21_21690 [Bacteroidetes bacterium B1(2017)]
MKTSFKIKMYILFLAFYSCTVEQKIGIKLPKESKLNTHLLKDTIVTFMTKQFMNEPYKIESIKVKNDTTIVFVLKEEWRYKLQLDTNCSIVKWDLLLEIY